MQRVRVKTNKSKFCSVPGCKNHKNASATYHSLPKNKKLQKIWLLKLKIANALPHYKVCSNHFVSSDYISTHNYAFKKYLKPNIAPTLSLPVGSIESKLSKIGFEESLDSRLKRDIGMNKLMIQEDLKKNVEAYIEPNIVHRDKNIDKMNNESTDKIVSTSSNVEKLQAIDIEDKRLKISKLAPISFTSVTTTDIGVQVESLNNRFSVLRLLKVNSQLNAYTGVHSMRLCDAIVKCMIRLKREQGVRGNNILSVKERVVLTLMKMKLNISYACLAVLFGVCANTCKNVLNETLADLKIIFTSILRWPDKEEILKNIPKCFEKYSSTAAVVDCTEVKIENTRCLKCKIRTYSHYKATHTAKLLISVTPSGLISYASSAFGGRTSDKQIFNQSEILNKMSPNVDAIMADKGFMIAEECALHGVKLIRPPSAKQKKLLTSRDKESTNVASARVHVERVIQRLKQFKILQGPMPHHLVKQLDSMIVIICGIVNLSAPILAENKFTKG